MEKVFHSLSLWMISRDLDKRNHINFNFYIDMVTNGGGRKKVLYYYLKVFCAISAASEKWMNAMRVKKEKPLNMFP